MLTKVNNPHKIISQLQNTAVSLKFSKKEKLKSRKAIEQLFQARQSIHVFPLRLIWRKLDFPLSQSPAQFAVSVPKRAFGKAVHRNRIKRIIREVYRLHKADFYAALPKEEGQFGCMLLYSGRREPTFAEIEKSLKKLIRVMPKKLKRKEDK